MGLRGYSSRRNFAARGVRQRRVQDVVVVHKVMFSVVHIADGLPLCQEVFKGNTAASQPL